MDRETYNDIYGLTPKIFKIPTNNHKTHLNIDIHALKKEFVDAIFQEKTL